VNGELGGWDFDATNRVLPLKLSDGKWITLHPQKIAGGPWTWRKAAPCWNGSRGGIYKMQKVGGQILAMVK
jgi:hypothetical protein